MKGVTDMLEEVHSKLYLEVKVAKYEVQTRHLDLVEEVNSYVNEVMDIVMRKNKVKEQPEEEKKDEDEQAAQ